MKKKNKKEINQEEQSAIIHQEEENNDVIEQEDTKSEKEAKKAEKKALKEAKKLEKKALKEAKKAKKIEEKNNEVKLTFKEKCSLSIRRKWLVNRTRTLFLILILVLAYIALNIGIINVNLPKIDLTESKVYSLSEESKVSIEKLNQDVKIYTYGFEETSTQIDLLKQYNRVNEKITYEILTEEKNLEMIKENNLQSGYYVMIFESGNSKKVVDSSEFYTYDYTTGEELDITEQSITNAIMSLSVENKPKIYFTQGHQEYTLEEELTVLQLYLENESFETENINLATVEAVPEDCAVLAIMSPATDLYDIERDMILNYISEGGKIYFSFEPMPGVVDFPNIRTVLSQYGVSFENGQIIELSSSQALQASPNVFKPRISMVSPITQDIAKSGGEIWLAYSARLKFESDETLSNLNIVKEELLSSTDESIFIPDLSTDIQAAIETAEKGSSTIATKLTKTIESGENTVESSIILTANGSFISNYIVDSLSANFPLSYIGNNKDFAINCMANLAEREGLTIRKAVTSNTYIPTNLQMVIVLIIIFVVPVIIIIVGLVVWVYRRKRK